MQTGLLCFLALVLCCFAQDSFPTDLPTFSQPSGTSTGQGLIQLNDAYQFGAGIEKELQELISQVLQISLNSVVVVTVTNNEEASVIICSGNADDFFNDLNSQDAVFTQTVLQGAYVRYAFWGVECRNPLLEISEPVQEGSPDSPEPITTDGYDFDFSTFRFADVSSNSPDSPFQLAPSNRYISSGRAIVPLDDDEFLVVEVNSSPVVVPFVAFIIALAVFLC